MELKPVKLTTEEQETTITFDRVSKKLRLYTSDNTQITKMQKLINVSDSAWKLEKVVLDKDGEPTGYFFSAADKKLLTLRAKRTILTEEQREAVVERLQRAKKKD